MLLFTLEPAAIKYALNSNEDLEMALYNGFAIIPEKDAKGCVVYLVKLNGVVVHQAGSLSAAQYWIDSQIAAAEPTSDDIDDHPRPS